MRGDRLRMFERTAVEQIGSNSGRPEGVTVGGGAQRCLPAAPLDHAKHILSFHSYCAEAPLFDHAAPQRRAFLICQTTRVKIGVEIFFGLVMGRHVVVFAAFFMQPDHQRFPCW